MKSLLTATLRPDRKPAEAKTPSKLDEIMADYHSKVKESRMQAMHRRRRMEGNTSQDVFATCLDVSRFTEEEAIVSQTPAISTSQDAEAH